MSFPIKERVAVGSKRIPNRREFHYPPNINKIDSVTDGRRTGLGIGFQTPYFSVVPKGTDIQLFWIGNNVDEVKARSKLQYQLQKEYEKGHINNLVLTGGEHVHPNISGTKRKVDIEELQKYGDYDIARDIVGEELLKLADQKHLPIIAICRGSQLALNHYSDKLTSPGDHEQQDYHSFIRTPEGKVILRQHAVKDILPDELRNNLNMKPPFVSDVNSAHAQGYRVCDISEEAMKHLHDNGWYPWLIAYIPGIAQEQQVIEGWLRVEGNKLTGVMTQFHPERQNDENGERVRQFMREIILANTSHTVRRSVLRNMLHWK